MPTPATSTASSADAVTGQKGQSAGRTKPREFETYPAKTELAQLSEGPAPAATTGWSERVLPVAAGGAFWEYDLSSQWSLCGPRDVGADREVFDPTNMH